MNDPLLRLMPYLKHDEVCLIPPGPGAYAKNCICGAGRAMIAARAEVTSTLTARFIACGRTWFNDRSEELTQSMRREQGYKTGGGCGVRMDVTHAYRCVECGRWMHQTCLKLHFEESRHHLGYRGDRPYHAANYEPAQPSDRPDKAVTAAPDKPDAGAALSELIETIREPIEEAFKGVLDELFRDRR
jgi:hypothetical protein